MKTLPTVTIGIPAFNEAGNIRSLLDNLFKQKAISYKLDKILISSDGSTDNTVSEIKSLTLKNTKVFANPNRQGIARGLNQIIKNTHTDVLVLLDADIILKDNYVIENLVNPIIRGEADLTSSDIQPLPPQNYIQKILYQSVRLKNIIFVNFSRGNNAFSCHGPIRALSANMYLNMEFPKFPGNDMYSFLYCQTKGLRFKYIPETCIYYHLPENLSDYLKQSRRFASMLRSQSREFDQHLITNAVKIPTSDVFVILPKLILEALKHPILTVSYLILLGSSWSVQRSGPEITDKWEIAVSTKHIN